MKDFEQKFKDRWPRFPHQVRTAIVKLYGARRNVDLLRQSRVIVRQRLDNPLDQTLATTLIERRELPQIQRLMQGAW